MKYNLAMLSHYLCWYVRSSRILKEQASFFVTFKFELQFFEQTLLPLNGVDSSIMSSSNFVNTHSIEHLCQKECRSLHLECGYSGWEIGRRWPLGKPSFEILFRLTCAQSFKCSTTVNHNSRVISLSR